VWLDQHKDISEIGKKKKVDLVFLGNSKTQSWCSYDRNVWGPGQKHWDTYYKNRQAANFGISGDKVENILWRVENGNFDNCFPKVVVLLAGTNNLKENSAEYIVSGVQQIVKSIHQKSPKTKVMVLGIFPRGETPNAEFRGKIEKINNHWIY
jgi:beta-glucosidase